MFIWTLSRSKYTPHKKNKTKKNLSLYRQFYITITKPQYICGLDIVFFLPNNIQHNDSLNVFIYFILKWHKRDLYHMRNADSRSKIAHIFLHKCKCFCVLENSPSATLADFLLMKEFGCSTFSIHCTENHTIVLKESKPRKFKTVRLDMTIRLPFRCVTVTCPALFFSRREGIQSCFAWLKIYNVGSWCKIQQTTKELVCYSAANPPPAYVNIA